jgi:DNA invertase Pin-like site-specific DNA recombinase
VTKAIGYVRVSTLKQGQNGFGLAAQRDAIESYCEANNLELLTVIPDVISSRKTDKMYGRAAAVAAVQAGIADVLVVHALDRASRNPVDGGLLIEQAHDEGWRLLSLDGVDSSDPDQSFLNDMRLAFAKEERKKVSDRTKIGLRRAKREGKQLGRPSTIPCNIVERTVEMRMRDRLSAKVIAKRLTDEGVPTPGGGSAWAHSTVRGVFARQRIQ